MSKRELFERHPGNPILTSADWPYPVNAVFNPAAAVVGDETLVLARVEDLRGISHLSVARSANGVDGWTVDPEPLLAPDRGDRERRVGIRGSSGRLGHRSSSAGRSRAPRTGRPGLPSTWR